MLVLISRLGFENTIRAKEYLQSKDVYIDAVYHHKSNTCYTNYSQIYEDFMMPPSKIANSVMILGSISIVEEELDVNSLHNNLEEYAEASSMYINKQSMSSIFQIQCRIPYNFVSR